MQATTLISAVLILFGALTLGVAAAQTGKILTLISGTPHEQSWGRLRILMFLFLLGYMGALGVVFTASEEALSLLMGAVFLGGAAFVMLVVRLGHTTMSELSAAAVTEKKRRHDLQRTLGTLEHTNEALTKSNAELEQFAYVASHDLQEPLRKIKAFGDLLGQEFADELGEDGQMYVERMRKAAGRMSTLIDDLLAFSRVTRKGEEFVELDLQKIADNVIDDLQTRLEETKGAVEMDPLPTLPVRKTQMRQLIQNLISNGLKFQRKDVPPVVKITVENIEDPDLGPMCQFTFQDNGIGFDPKHSERIFGIFQRLHGRSEYEGTGVGLSICQKIVIGHGGRIHAEGTPGEGARFIFTLPRERVALPGSDDES